MKKNRCVLAAVIVSLFLSSFEPFQRRDTGSAWYNYVGQQTASERKNASNYVLASYQPTCLGGPNECSVEMNVTLDIFGNPPYHPDFSNTSFNVATGAPIQGLDVILNQTTN